jgi:hypothetical protein
MSAAGRQHPGFGQSLGVVVPRDQYHTDLLLRAVLPENLNAGDAHRKPPRHSSLAADKVSNLYATELVPA